MGQATVIFNPLADWSYQEAQAIARSVDTGFIWTHSGPEKKFLVLCGEVTREQLAKVLEAEKIAPLQIKVVAAPDWRNPVEIPENYASQAISAFLNQPA